jgi:hypothetical protein
MKISEITKQIVETAQAVRIRPIGPDAEGNIQYEVKPLCQEGSKYAPGWVILDLFTASAMQVAHNALSPQSIAKYDRIELMTLVDFTWKVCGKIV